MFVLCGDEPMAYSTEDSYHQLSHFKYFYKQNVLNFQVRFEESAPFAIYGMDVTSLRRLNQHEK